MSYAKSKGKSRPGAIAAMGLDWSEGVLDFIIGPPAVRLLGDLSSKDSASCIDQANAQVAGLDARTATLSSTWTPTGTFTAADMQKMVQAVMSQISAATNAVGSAPRSTSDADQMIAEALDHLFTDGNDSLQYTTGAVQAQQSGALVQASDFKAWVIRSMQDVSAALVTASAYSCDMNWLANAIITFQSGFDNLVAVCIAIAGEVVAAGQQVISIGWNFARVTAVLIQAAPYVGALALAYYLFSDKGKGSGTSIL